MRVMLLVLTLLVAGAGFAQEHQQRFVYKWTDTEGLIHYTAMPPPAGTTFEAIPIRSAPPQVRRQAQSQASRGESPPASSEESSEEGLSPEQVAFLKQQCEAARNNLKALEGGGTNRRFRGPDGEVIRFTEEERQAEIAKNQSYLDENCQ